MSSFPINNSSITKFKENVSEFLKSKNKATEDKLNSNIKLNKKETAGASTMGYKKYFVGAQDFQTSSNYFLTGDVTEGDTFTLYA